MTNCINTPISITPAEEDMEKRLKTPNLMNVALTMKNPSEFPWQDVWNKVNDKTISDESRILIMRAMIYNLNMRPHFQNISTKFNHVIRSLIIDNKEINRQMDRPINTKIKSGKEDTLMHCAGRLGYPKLMYHLYNAGAGDSLSIKNAHGYSPVASISNQRERVVEWGMEKDENGHSICTLTPQEQIRKENYLRGLDEARKTYHDLVAEETLMNSKLVRNAVVQKEPQSAQEASGQAFKDSGMALVEGNRIKSGWKLIQALCYLLHLTKFKKDEKPLLNENNAILEENMRKAKEGHTARHICQYAMAINMPIFQALSRTL